LFIQRAPTQTSFRPGRRSSRRAQIAHSLTFVESGWFRPADLFWDRAACRRSSV